MLFVGKRCRLQVDFAPFPLLPIWLNEFFGSILSYKKKVKWAKNSSNERASFCFVWHIQALLELHKIPTWISSASLPVLMGRVLCKLLRLSFAVVGCCICPRRWRRWEAWCCCWPDDAEGECEFCVGILVVQRLQRGADCESCTDKIGKWWMVTIALKI